MNELVEYSYEIEQLGVHKELHGRKNVIYEIRAFLVGKVNRVEENTTNTFSEKVFFVVHIPTDDLHKFIEYEKLTKEDIDDMIDRHTSEQIKEVNKSRLFEQINPTKVYLKPNF